MVLNLTGVLFFHLLDLQVCFDCPTIPVPSFKKGVKIWRDGEFVNDEGDMEPSVAPLNNYLGPTINADMREPLRREWTPSANRLVTNEITMSEIGAKSNIIPGFKFTVVTPEVIESDYFGNLSFTYTGGQHVHAIISNPGRPVTELVLGTKSEFQFTVDFGRHVHRMVLGMMYQWEISCLELFREVVKQGFYCKEHVESQKNWMLNFLPDVYKAMAEWHHLMPLPLLRKEHYTVYLGHIFDDGDMLEFLYNMINCKKIDVVACQGQIFKIGTRFDDDDERFFAFGF